MANERLLHKFQTQGTYRSIQVLSVPPGERHKLEVQQFQNNWTEHMRRKTDLTMFTVSCGALEGFGSSIHVITVNWIVDGHLHKTTVTGRHFDDLYFIDYIKSKKKDRTDIFTERGYDPDIAYLSVDEENGLPLLQKYPAGLMAVLFESFWAMAYWCISAQQLNFYDEDSEVMYPHMRKPKAIEGIVQLNADAEEFFLASLARHGGEV